MTEDFIEAALAVLNDWDEASKRPRQPIDNRPIDSDECQPGLLQSSAQNGSPERLAQNVQAIMGRLRQG